MNNNIEDIYIGANYNSNNKKGKNIVLFFIIFLLIILIAVIACYIYFFKGETINAKQLFFNHLSNNNVQELVSENTYEGLTEKLLNTNFEANSTMNFSTNIENEKLEGLDISKFTFNLNSYSNKSSNKTYTELGVNYSGNKVLEPIKIITNEDSIGIAQDETVNKYVGIHYDSLNDVLGIDLNKDKINNLFKTEKNDLTEEYKKQLISKNINKIAEMIPEEKFTFQENIAISQNDTNIPVTAYTLQLSQSELNNILVELFKNIRNDEELLNKIVYKEKDKPSINIAPNSSITVTPVTEDENLVEEQPEEQIEEQLEENNPEENSGQQEFEAEATGSFEPISGEVNEFNEPQFEEGENEEQINDEQQFESFSEVEQEYTPELELTRTAELDELGEENNINLEILNTSNDFSEIIKLLLGLKINKTLEETQEMLDLFIEKLDSLNGNGLTITVYASKDKTEKISIVLPNENTVEIEILKKSDSENKMKLTYLYKGNDSIFSVGKMEVLSDDNFNEIKSVEDEVLENQTNGISLEIRKVKTTTDTSIDATVSIIEDEKINKKINLKSDISGDSSSNSMTNNLILTVSTKENESKLVLDTNFKFSRSGEEIPDLVDENCLFMETLSQEDYDITVQAIKDKIDFVWDEKKQQFDFIDTNTKSSTKNIDRVSTNITIDNAREALQNKISAMMNEAAENEQEFTLQNLENLQMEGYEVSSVVNENEAVIVVDVYTFNVNNEFNIIDA